MNQNMKNSNKSEPVKFAADGLVLPFILMTIGITWAFWWSIVIANQFGYLKHGTPIMMVFFIIGGLAPSISSITLILKTKQMKGKELFKIIFDFRQPVFLYLIVIVIALLMYVIPLLLHRATALAPIYVSILLLPVNLIGGGLEEIGWRFLFQPALEKKTNFITATILTSVVWALWHLPLFFIAGTNQSTWNFLVFAILAFGLSFLLSAIYKVGGSVWLCILFHTVWNSLGESIGLSMDIVTVSGLSAFLIVIAFLLLKFVPKRACEN